MALKKNHTFVPGTVVSVPDFTIHVGTSHKLLKACNFCRKRKIKCVANNSGKCESCKEHNHECIFDHKVVPRKKTIRNNLYIPTKTKNAISETITNSSKNLTSYTGTFLDQVDSFALKEFNRNVDDTANPYIEARSSAVKQLSPNPVNNSAAEHHEKSIRDLYVTAVEPYSPFLHEDMFNPAIYGRMDQFARCCINIAAASSLNNNIPDSALDLFLEMLHGFFESPIEWTELNLACFFLLPQRIVVPSHIVKQSLEAFNELCLETFHSLSPNIMAGALCVDAWNALFTDQQLLTNPPIIKRCVEIFSTLDIKDHNYQFIHLNIFLYKLIWLRHDTNTPIDDKRGDLLRFEFDMLLFPAKLSKNLMVVKDTLLSTPEAFILHILHNMLMITYYTHAVSNKETFGKLTSLTAVPGLYHFISGMAISNFRVTDEIIKRWAMIADCQIYTAKLLLSLYRVMEFDTFVFTLLYYNSRPNTSFSPEEKNAVDSDVRNFLDTHKPERLRDDDFDGAVVFWVFRDVRSMSLQFYIDEERERRRSSETASTMSLQ